VQPAHNLDWGTVVYRVDMRDEKARERRREHWHDPLQDARRNTGPVRLDAGDGAIAVIAHVVEARHVHALDLGQRAQLGVSRRAAHLLNSPRDVDDRFFALADHECVDKAGHRLRVVAGVAARDHERITLVALGGANRHPGQIEHISARSCTAARTAG